ncbi:MAG: hypothetical protein ABI723_12875 [Bacteroidia bacterium]
MLILTNQKNEIYSLIEQIGLDPGNFEWSRSTFLFSIHPTVVGKNVPADKLIYKGTDFYFLFGERVKITSHYAEFSPGKESYVEENYPGDWQHQVKNVDRWLGYLKTEVLQEDKWIRLQKQISNLNFGFNYKDGSFSVTEYQELSSKIDTLHQRLESIGLQQEEIKLLREILKHTKEVAKDMNKVDWKNLFIGSIISAVVQLSLTPESAKTLWHLIKEVFNKLLLP